MSDMCDWSISLPKQCCSKCHFLEQASKSGWSEVSWATRERLLEDTPPRPSDSDIKCHRGVWDPAKRTFGGDLPVELSRDRQQEPHRCYSFYPYSPTMLFRTAIKFVAKATAEQDAKKSRQLSMVAIGISVLA